MKKTTKFRNIFLLLVASFLMLTPTLTAQTDCLVDFPPYSPEPPAGSSAWCYPQSKEYNVRIAFHIIKDVNGRGGTTQAQLDDAILTLVNDFSPSITFTVVSTDNVISTTAKNYFADNAYKLPRFSNEPTPPLFFDLVAENKVSDALNVYLGPSTNPNDGGIAWPSRLSCTIAGTRAETSGSNYLVTSHAISHEIAHLLSLSHTFFRQPSENQAVLPLVNGQNCSVSGDLVCDTPVDPTQPTLDKPNPFDFRRLLSSCSWNNTTKKDPSNTLYQPSTTNIMAYTHISCMENFTDGQFRRMHNYCLTDPLLNKVVTVYNLNWFSCGGGGSSSLKAIIKTEELDFRVFPNPASEFLNIHFFSDSKETELQITNIIGKNLYQKRLGRTSKQDVHEIDFNALPKGIHILTVSNELDKKTTKIVIQ